MTKTGKNRKREDKSQRALVIKKIAIEYNVTETYIRQCVLDYYTSEKADDIKKEYNRLMKAIDNVFHTNR